MKRSLSLASLCAALTVSLPAMAFDLKHSTGSIHLADQPSRIVSYDLGVLDSLTALEIDAVAVPKSNFKDALTKYNQAPVVGTLFEPDFPALTAQNPQLIFSGRRSVPAIPELEKLAPVAIFNDDPLDFWNTFNKTAEAEKSLQAIENNLAELKAANQNKTGAFLFVYNDMVMAQAPGDRFGFSYELTGLTSLLEATDPNAPVAPRPEPGSKEAKAAAKAQAEVIEKIAKANPDWLIVLDRIAATNPGEKPAPNTINTHPLLSKTKAVQKGQVVYVDPVNWYIVTGGLNNLKNITDELLAQMKK